MNTIHIKVKWSRHIIILTLQVLVEHTIYVTLLKLNISATLVFQAPEILPAKIERFHILLSVKKRTLINFKEKLSMLRVQL